MEIFKMEQNSPEWFEVRRGIPTASKFATVMAGGEGKTRSKYMRELAGDILTGESVEGFKNKNMERGNAMEAEAVSMYAIGCDEELEQVGFIRDGAKGCSPDRLVGKAGILEIKTAEPQVLIDILFADRVPPEHSAQIQGGLWVAKREWCDLAIYWPKMPLFKKRVARDEMYIRKISDAVEAFNSDLAAMVERLKRLGGIK
jgi:YqaJ-like viral recombinase domain